MTLHSRHAASARFVLKPREPAILQPE